LANIVLTRVDDRLIHGQVMTAWVKHTFGNRIIIIDDLVAVDEFMVKVLRMAAPPGIHVEVYNTEEGANKLKEDSAKGENVIILVKYPKTIEELINRGVLIKELVVGGMAAAVGRKKFYKNISASTEEKETFKQLLKKGVDIHIRIVPDDRPIPISKYL